MKRETMRDIPIIFSAPMVNALLAGRKTQTRRLAWRWADDGVEAYPTPWQKVNPGDRLWVREAFFSKCGETHHPECCRYAATYDGLSGSSPRWTPSIHMPRWASRLTLTVTATKVEPLTDISADDAVAEGLWYCEEGDAAGFWFASPEATESGVFGEGAVDCYMRLWDHLHGDGAWEANPEVVALTFEVHKANIDALKEAA